MYLSAGIIFSFGKLHPVVGKLQLSLWGTSMSTMHSCSVQAKGNSSFPAVFKQLWRGEWLWWKSPSGFLFFVFVCFYQPRLLFVLLPLTGLPTLPPSCHSSPPCYFLCHAAGRPRCPRLPLSIFNYDHTERGFESLSCKAARFLITKLISKWAEKMTGRRLKQMHASERGHWSE